MRILIITGSCPPMRCGVGDYSCRLAKALASLPGIDVGVITSVYDGEISKAEGVEIFPVIKRWSLAKAPKVIKTIRQWSPDIVHIQYPTQGYRDGLLSWLLPIISFFMGKKVVQTWHEGYSRRYAPSLFLISIVPSRLVVVRPQYKEQVLNPMFGWALWKKKPLFIKSASCIPPIDLSEQERDVLKKRYLKKQKRLVVFFGFAYPHKGVELLFDIADPAQDQLVIAGEIAKRDYLHKIMRRVSTGQWARKTTVTGFLPDADMAALLAAADAVILPFRNGGGEWNSSIHGAVLNRAFVITTSLTQSGYDKKRNIYFAKVDDVQEMRSALAAYAGTRREYNADVDKDEWRRIADRHKSLYESLYERDKVEKREQGNV